MAVTPRSTFFPSAFLTMLLIASVTCLPIFDSPTAFAEPEAESAKSAKTLTATGSDSMADLMEKWSLAFRAKRADVTIQLNSQGSASAPPSLIEGLAEMGPMAREMKSDEIESFQRKFGFAPTKIRTGLTAIGLYVSAKNPLNAVTLDQLDAMYAVERKRGAERPIERWSDLGVKGELAEQNIALLGLAPENQSQGFFRQQVMGLGTFQTGLITAADTPSLWRLLAENPAGIAFGELGRAPADVKLLAIRHDRKLVLPTEKNLWNSHYPLVRFLNIYFVRAPEEPMDTSLSEFLKFVLSDSGQEVVRQAGFVPLTSAVRNEELRKIQ